MDSMYHLGTMGGVYENQTSPVVDIEVVNSLCDNLKFSTGEDVVPMPAEYYPFPIIETQVTYPLIHLA